MIDSVKKSPIIDGASCDVLYALQYIPNISKEKWKVLECFIQYPLIILSVTYRKSPAKVHPVNLPSELTVTVTVFEAFCADVATISTLPAAGVAT